MAQFCTKCGTPAEPDARFCEDCGAPYNVAVQPVAVAAAVPAAAAAPSRDGKRAALLGGVVLALFAVLGGVAYLTADEAASPALFARAIDRYYAGNPAAADQLLCAGDLRLEDDPVSVNDFDPQHRQTMNLLVQAGLFKPPQVEASGGFLRMQSYHYRRTEAGKRAIRQGKLCVAPAMQVKRVQFHQDHPGTQVAATFLYELKQPEVWMKGELGERISRSLGLGREHVAVMELQNGKWVMTTDSVRIATAVAAGRLAVPEKTLAQRMQSWFRSGNPLIGKWRVANSPWLAGVVISFGAEQAAVGAPTEAVRYEITGDDVKVYYLTRKRSDRFSIVDNDHINLMSDTEVLQLERIKEEQ